MTSNAIPEGAPETKLRQIRTMLDMVADERTHPVERERAMERATKLMADYGVTEMMLNAYRRGKADEIITREVSLGNPYSAQKSLLLAWVADALTCRVVKYNWGREYFRAEVTGFRTDVERVELLYTSLLLQMFNGAKDVRPEWYDDTPTTTFRKNWMEGFASRVSQRIAAAEQAARDRYDREYAGTGSTGTALVVVERQTLVEQAFELKYPKIKKAKRIKRGGSGRGAGAEAGTRADIGGTKVDDGQRKALTAR